MADLTASERYKIIGSSIVPRPIAWISSLSPAGAPNLAPFSFFNAVGHAPPIVAIGMVPSPTGGLKDTPSNIRDTGEFVVNLVSEGLATAMNQTSFDYPPEANEAALVNVEMAPSSVVKPQRVAGAPVSFECKCVHYMETGPQQALVLGEILVAHIADAFVRDPARIHLDIDAMQLIARSYGRGFYSRQTDLFEMVRPG